MNAATTKFFNTFTSQDIVTDWTVGFNFCLTIHGNEIRIHYFMAQTLVHMFTLRKQRKQQLQNSTPGTYFTL